MFIGSSLWNETPAKIVDILIMFSIKYNTFSTCKNGGLLVEITFAIGEIVSNQIILQMG